MVRSKMGKIAQTAAGLLLLLAMIGCSSGDDGTIPITTASEKALENYLTGRDLAEKLRGQESRKYFEMAVAEDPDFVLGHLQLAFSQPTNKGFFESFNRALAGVDRVSEGERLWVLGIDAANNGDPMRQRELYQKLVAAYPLDQRAWNLLGGHYFGQQEYDKSIEYYSKAIEIDSEFSAPYNQLGYAYRSQEKYPEAETTFRKYITLIPDDPNPHDSYAELLMKIGKFDESIENYSTALKINSNFPASHAGIACDLTYLGKHVQAREQLDKLLADAKDDGQRRFAHFVKVFTYVDEGNFDAAMEELKIRQAFAEKISDYSALAGDANLAGTVLLEAGKIDEAIAQFNLAVEYIEKSDLAEDIKDNTRQAFHYNAGCVALKRNDIEAAKASLEAYSERAHLTKSPFQIRALHQLAGMIALEKKDYNKAIEELDKASQLNPYNFYRMARAYEGLKDMAKAREFYERAANFNALNNLNQAFIRSRAAKAIASI